MGNHDPTLLFRKTQHYRLELDFNRGVARRLTRAPFIIGEDDGFLRSDKDKHRFFGEVQDWVLQNKAFQALKASCSMASRTKFLQGQTLTPPDLTATARFF